MISQLVAEDDVFNIQRRIDERHITVVDIAVDAVDGKPQLAHEGRCSFGIAGGEHRKARIIEERVVVAGLAGKQLHAAAVLVVFCREVDRSLVDVVILDKISTVGENFIFVELMNHFNGIRGYLKEAERERNRDSSALCRVFSDRERAEYDRVGSGESETVPDHFIIRVAAEFLFHNDHGGDESKRPEHFLTADLLDFVERLNAYRQHGEADEEGIAVGEVIREVEAVEGEVCPVVRHEQHQHSQQTAEADAGSQPDFAAGEEYGNQQDGKYRAVDVRQVVAAFRGGIAEKCAGENIPEVEITCHCPGEFILSA